MSTPLTPERLAEIRRLSKRLVRNVGMNSIILDLLAEVERLRADAVALKSKVDWYKGWKDEANRGAVRFREIINVQDEQIQGLSEANDKLRDWQKRAVELIELRECYCDEDADCNWYRCSRCVLLEEARGGE